MSSGMAIPMMPMGSKGVIGLIALARNARHFFVCIRPREHLFCGRDIRCRAPRRLFGILSSRYLDPDSSTGARGFCLRCSRLTRPS